MRGTVILIPPFKHVDLGQSHAGTGELFYGARGFGRHSVLFQAPLSGGMACTDIPSSSIHPSVILLTIKATVLT